MRNVTDEENRWRLAAAGLGLPLSAERVARIAPVLSDLDRRVRAALDRDLRLIEPAQQFRPDGK